MSLLLAVAALLQPSASRAGAGGCIVPSSAWPVVLLGAAAGAELDEAVPPPPSEREIETLLRELEWVELEDGGARRRLDLGEGGAFEPARLRVLLADSLALLASVHAEEAASHLREGEQKALRARLSAVQACARARFASRGGEPAYADALELVRRNRRGLEAALLEGPARAKRCCLWDAIRAVLPGGKEPAQEETEP